MLESHRQQLDLTVCKTVLGYDYRDMDVSIAEFSG